MMTLIGGSIQQVAYTAMGNTAEANRLEREYFSYANTRTAADSGWRLFNKVDSIMSFDLDLTLFWLDNLIEFGEVSAVENTLAEARRLSADPGYRPCRSPGP